MNPTYRFGNQQKEVCMSEVKATVQPLGVASVLSTHALPVPKAPILISAKSMSTLGGGSLSCLPWGLQSSTISARTGAPSCAVLRAATCAWTLLMRCRRSPAV